MPELVTAHPFRIEAGAHYEPHAHDHHELILIQQGRLRVRIMNSEHIAHAGNVLLYPAGKLHEEWVLDGKPVVNWVCKFQWAGLSSPLFCHDPQGRLQDLVVKLSLMMRWPNARGSDAESRADLLRVLIDEITRLAAHGPQELVDIVRRYVREHIEEPFTLNDLAAVSGLSVSHLLRQYRAVTGRTPMKDARFLRLEEARRLIVTTTLPLHQIAPRVGIANEHHLSRLLKSLLGVSARELRG